MIKTEKLGTNKEVVDLEYRQEFYRDRWLSAAHRNFEKKTNLSEVL